MNAQTQPTLRITKNSSSVQVNWGCDSGGAYRLLHTPSLGSPIVWSPFEDVYATDTNASVEIAATASQIGFFRLQTLDGSTSAVQIFLPVAGQTLSGPLTVRIGADLGAAPSSVNIYLDDALIGVAQPDALDFGFDTSHFPNGNHALQVVALDSQNNEFPSDIVSVNFQNSVRWLDAETLFQSSVPIEVQSDLFPTNWTIVVQDLDGNTIKTMTSTTSDGNISTIWDGTDDAGTSVPAQALYKISVNVGESTSLQPIPPVSGPPPLPLQRNVASPVITPPLPPMPPDFPQQPSTTQQVSADSGLQSQSAQAGAAASSSTIVWREYDWKSGEILLARQKITGYPGLVFDGVCANLLQNVRTLVGEAQDSVTGDRAVFGGGITVVNTTTDWNTVYSALVSVNPEVTAFYWYGHGSRDGNSIGSYVSAKELSKYLGNLFYPVVTNSVGMKSRPTVITKAPFNFVFIDGCMTGKGMLPEAFGIPKAIPGTAYARDNKHKRAYMGWNGKVTAAILDTKSLTWSLNFWKKWLEDPNARTVQTAIIFANLQSTPSGGIQTYGDTTLTWSD